MMATINKLLEESKLRVNLVGTHSIHVYVLYREVAFTCKSTIETRFNFGLCPTNIGTNVTIYSHK